MDAHAIAEFLQQNPRFFEQHAEVFSELRVPHPHEDSAISLTERQLLTLRDKNRQLEGKMAELIEYGRENDDISEKLHRVTLALLPADSLELAVETLELALQENFGLAAVTVRLWPMSDAANTYQLLPAFRPVTSEIKDYASALTTPYCGPHAAFDALDWFDGHGGLASFSLIPLRTHDTFGLLALGSHDARRFHPDMGTLYLNRLGEIASASLGRFLR